MPSFLPYGHQSIDDSDIESVISVLKSAWLTTGPAIETFETDICAFTGARYGVAVSSGTAALHAAMFAIGVSKGDEVIVTPMTFAASANCILYQGGTPVFADVDPDTLIIDPEAVEAAITPRTKAIISVDYTGQPCKWDELRKIADKYHLALVDDACHALGAEYKGQKIGNQADITVFSFHPVKHITTGEGGMAVTNDSHLADRMRSFRGHGIMSTASQREKSGAWYYEMTDLGYNYRITDFQCALGSSQILKLPAWIDKRNLLANLYDQHLCEIENITPLQKRANLRHAYHLYVVKTKCRDKIFADLRSHNVGCNVHYTPVYLHPYYQHLGYRKGLCPEAEKAYQEIITLPLWPGMEESDIDRIIYLLAKNQTTY